MNTVEGYLAKTHQLPAGQPLARSWKHNLPPKGWSDESWNGPRIELIVLSISQSLTNWSSQRHGVAKIKSLLIGRIRLKLVWKQHSLRTGKIPGSCRQWIIVWLINCEENAISSWECFNIERWFNFANVAGQCNQANCSIRFGWFLSLHSAELMRNTN